MSLYAISVKLCVQCLDFFSTLLGQSRAVARSLDTVIARSGATIAYGPRASPAPFAGSDLLLCYVEIALSIAECYAIGHRPPSQ